MASSRRPRQARGSLGGLRRGSERKTKVNAAVLSAALQQKFVGDLSLDFRKRRPRKKKPAAATFALVQDLGIQTKPKPRDRPSDLEWNRIQQLARQRKASHFPCPICQEHFKMDAQVLLSCTHCFHHRCLSNFEKFSGARVCPICRHDGYAKKMINDGAEFWQQQSAIRIQSCYRGHVARKHYQHLKETVAPKEPAKRKEFYMNKWTKTSDRLMTMMDAKDNAIENLFAELEQSIAASQAAFSAAEDALDLPDDDAWKLAKAQAEKRDMSDCPICMMSFSAASKSRVLLSCSHVFHETCLSSFENFAAFNPQLTAPGCPLCRSTYHKLPLPADTSPS